MPLIELAPVIIFGSIFIIVILLTSTSKASPATLRKLINDYEVFADNCSDITGKINDAISRIKEKVFVSSADEENAIKAIRQYDSLYNDLLLLHEKMGFYLNKRNSKYYKKFRKEAEKIILQLNSVHNSLLSIEQYMETTEEYYAAQRERQRIFEEEQKRTEEWARRETERINEAKRNSQAMQNRNKNYGSVFFSGCNNIEEIEKRYKSLAKVYHPDMPTGNKDTFQIIHEEYERVRKIL